MVIPYLSSWFIFIFAHMIYTRVNLFMLSRILQNINNMILYTGYKRTPNKVVNTMKGPLPVAFAHQNLLLHFFCVFFLSSLLLIHFSWIKRSQGIRCSQILYRILLMPNIPERIYIFNRLWRVMTLTTPNNFFSSFLSVSHSLQSMLRTNLIF